MLGMMIAFFKDLWKFRVEVKKQGTWMQKYIKKNNYALNPDLMMTTNLKVWISEMQATFGQRFCPCFEPSDDKELNKKMMCPCEYVEDEIKEYGTCHCALFGRADLDKAGWKASSKRLMAEYQIPLNLKDGVLDTRGQVLDHRRNLPVPDAMHQLKSTLNNYKGKSLKMIVSTEQEVKNLEDIAKYRKYGFSSKVNDDSFEVNLQLKN
ncbi:Rubredoxin [hydrothermal vent metagenome]|uniref:ferredoxin:thioredoxin reductase n=1 Tax=hydrothermal vent metagenome TaxID=652676 RepID=A0A1W1C7T5_9ZZZZ